MYFDKKQVNYMEAASWSKSQSCTYTLVFSSLSYGLIFGLYMLTYIVRISNHTTNLKKPMCRYSFDFCSKTLLPYSSPAFYQNTFLIFSYCLKSIYIHHFKRSMFFGRSSIHYLNIQKFYCH